MRVLFLAVAGLLAWASPTTRAAAQALTVTLLDEAGETMIGVHAYTPDLAWSATSDFDGQLVIDGPALSDDITFSYTGYEPYRVAFRELRKQAKAAGRGAFQLSLKPSATALAEAVVIGRRGERAAQMAQTVTTIDAARIAQVNPQTSADVLEASGEVYVQRSQMGGGSPVVRGFEANRILLVVDGVRLNNAIYRSGHLQNAITVDAAMLQRAEVIFGAGSLHYGSDALGGVIHFRTKEPRLGKSGEPRSGGNFFARYASANREKTVHADHHFARKKWGSQTSVTVSMFEDLRMGANYRHAYRDYAQTPFYVPHKSDGEVLANPDPYIQRNTGYDQIDVLQKLKLQLSESRYVMANVQFSNSSDVPRFDRLQEVSGERPTDLKFAEWYYGPQRRFFSSLRMVKDAPGVFHDRAQWIASFQRMDEDRYERRLDRLWRTFSFVDVNVYGLTFDADKGFGESRRHVLSYGVEGQHNVVESLGGRIRITDETVLLDGISRYPSGGSTLSSAGAYLTYKYRSRNDRVSLEAGARYSYVALSSVFGRADSSVTEPVDWPTALREGITASNDALTYAAGGSVRVTPTTRVQVLGSTAFRAPNVDDFAKMRIKNGFVLVPNVALGPETAANAEVTLTQDIRRLGGEGFGARLSATAFASDIANVIVRRDGTLPNGDSTFVSGETVYRVQVNDNATRGEVRGVGLRADFSYGEHFTLGARATLTRGTSIDADDEEAPLAHIPPTHGQLRLAYQRNRLTLAATARHNGWKRWEDYAPAGSSDNEDLAIPGVGTPAWTVYDLAATVELTPKLDLQLSVRNLGDAHYRPFSSGVSAPGRDFVVGVRGRF